MKIYTRVGDGGRTNFHGRMLAKNHCLFRFLGSIDELTCRIGFFHEDVKHDLIDFFSSDDRKCNEKFEVFRESLGDVASFGQQLDPIWLQHRLYDILSVFGQNPQREKVFLFYFIF